MSSKQHRRKRTVAGGVFWTLIGSGGQAILQFFVLAVLARLVAPEDFGLLAAAMAVIGIGLLLSELGLGSALVHADQLSRHEIATGFWATSIVGSLFAAASVFFSPLIGELLGDERIGEVSAFLSLLFIARGIGLVPEALIQKHLSFRELVIVDVLSYSFGYGVSAILLGWMGYGATSLVIGTLGHQFSRSLALLLISRADIFCVPHVACLRRFLRYSGGITVARVLNYIALNADNIIIAKYLGSSALGHYGRAYQLAVVPANVLGGSLDRVLFPLFSINKSSPPRNMMLYQGAVALVGIFATPLAVSLYVFAPEIVYVLLGPGWSQTVDLVKLLAVVLGFRAGYKISDALCRGIGAVYGRAWIQGVYALAIVGAAYMGAKIGINKVAVGVSAAVVLNYLIMAFFATRLLGGGVNNLIVAHIPVLGALFFSTAVLTLVAGFARQNNLSPVAVVVFAALANVVLQVLMMRLTLKILLPYGLAQKVNETLARLPPALKKILGVRVPATP